MTPAEVARIRRSERKRCAKMLRAAAAACRFPAHSPTTATGRDAVPVGEASRGLLLAVAEHLEGLRGPRE